MLRRLFLGLSTEGLNVYVKCSQLITKTNCGTAMEARSGRKKESHQETSELFSKVTPRKFGTKGEETTYQRGGVLNHAVENREIEYKSLTGAPAAMLRWKIMEKAKTFICACLNGNRKGTIYFGIGDPENKQCSKLGEILGLHVEDLRDDIGKAFQYVLDNHIKSDVGPLQKGGDQDCVNMVFVPVVSQGSHTGLYVIEIDVYRDWKFCKDHIYYCTTWDNKTRGHVNEDKDKPKKKALKDFYIVHKDKYNDVAIRTFGSSSHVKQHQVHFHVRQPLTVEYAEWQRKAKLGADKCTEGKKKTHGEAFGHESSMPSTSGDSPTAAAWDTLKGLKDMSSVLNLMRPMIRAPNLGADITAEKDNNGKEGQPVENKDWSLLHSAAEGGDVSIIKIILSNGIEVNSKDSFGATPLMIAAAKCKKEAVDFLLSKGADPSLTTNTGRNSLHAAAEGGDVSIVQTMLLRDIPLDSTDNDGITSLMIAAALNNIETVKILFSKGADPLLKSNEGRTALFFTALGGHTDVIKLILSYGLEIDSRDDKGLTTLMLAAACANLQAVSCLLENGANPQLRSNNGWSPLHFASKADDAAIIKTLLSAGADVNVQSASITLMTPLMVAIREKKMEAIKCLLKNGADPLVESGLIRFSSLLFALYGDPESTVLCMIEAMLSSGLDVNAQSSSGWTALMCAAFLNKREVFDFLLSNGGDLSVKDNDGRTVLHHASEGGDMTIIEKCLSYGLDIESKDNDGKTALDLAACSGSLDAFRFLRERCSIKNS